MACEIGIRHLCFISCIAVKLYLCLPYITFSFHLFPVCPAVQCRCLILYRISLHIFCFYCKLYFRWSEVSVFYLNRCCPVCLIIISISGIIVIITYCHFRCCRVYGDDIGLITAFSRLSLVLAGIIFHIIFRTVCIIFNSNFVISICFQNYFADSLIAFFIHAPFRNSIAAFFLFRFCNHTIPDCFPIPLNVKHNIIGIEIRFFYFNFCLYCTVINKSGVFICYCNSVSFNCTIRVFLNTFF